MKNDINITELILILILLFVLYNINYHEYFHVSIQFQQQDENDQLVDALLDDNINSNISFVPINNNVTSVVYNGDSSDLSGQHNELSIDARPLIPEDEGDISGLLLGIIIIVGASLSVCAITRKNHYNFKKPTYINNDDLEEGTELTTYSNTNPSFTEVDALTARADKASLTLQQLAEATSLGMSATKYVDLSPRQRFEMINKLQQP
jgi:hypothetical protein